MSETGPSGDETAPAGAAGGAPPAGSDRARLKALADGFVEQSGQLRRRAAWNIRSIVVTVVLMTVIVVALPPMINVVEDRILGYFGYQTSQLDFQRETARQAADVRARSQRLLELLDQRDAAIERMREAVSQPLGAFAPERLETPDWADQPIVFGAAETGDLQVAVGRLSRSPSGPPLIAFRNRGEGAWSLWRGADPNQPGDFGDVAVLGDSLLVGGGIAGEPLLLRIGPDRRVGRAFAIPGPIETVGAVAASPDGAHVATAGVVGGTGHLRVTTIDGELVWRDRFPAGLIADLHWRDGDLLALTGPGDVALRVYPDAATGPRSPEDAVFTLLEGGSPLGFRVDRQARGGVVAFATENDGNALRRFERRDDGSWTAGGLADEAALGEARIWGRAALAETRLGDLVYGGAGESALARITTDRRGPTVTPVPLRSAEFEARSYLLHVLGDGVLRLSPIYQTPPADRSSHRAIFWVEATPPEIPAPAPDAPLRAFLEGIAPLEGEAPLGGDATAEAAGLAARVDAVAASVAAAQAAVREGGMLLAADAFAAADALDGLAATWRAEWEERERAATTLARLRQADQAGSLWRNVSSLAARLAVIALLIYLVNILVNLYRYNMRLAAFYQARGDALETALASGADLSALVGGSLIDLARAHTPEDVTFGARPAPPTEAIARTVQELSKTLKP